MIQLDRSRIARHNSISNSQRSKLLMPVVQGPDAPTEFRRSSPRARVAMASSAGLSARTCKMDLYPMFHMTFGTSELCVSLSVASFRANWMVFRPVMASQARRIRRFRRKSARFSHMASCALPLQHRVRPAQPPTRINTLVPAKKVPPDPHQR
jgi:hypothetical protein